MRPSPLSGTADNPCPASPLSPDALEMLMRMEHRGACGCDENTGDGAGILLNIPHTFFHQRLSEELGVALPAPKHYAVGQLFLPRKSAVRMRCKELFTTVRFLCNQCNLGLSLLTSPLPLPLPPRCPA